MQHKLVICALLWVHLRNSTKHLFQLLKMAEPVYMWSLYLHHSVFVCATEVNGLVYSAQDVSFIALLCFTNLRVFWLLNTWLIGKWLLQVVKEVLDPAATIEFCKNTADDPHMRKPDISKAKDLLGWEPKVALRKGLAQMVEDFRQRILNDHNEGSENSSARYWISSPSKESSLLAWGEYPGRSVSPLSWK